MATTFMSSCACGEHLQVYVPKAMLAEWMPSVYGDDSPEELAELDAEEQSGGEIPMARFMAKLLGAQFVDVRESQACPTCGADLGIREGLMALKGEQ